MFRKTALGGGLGAGTAAAAATLLKGAETPEQAAEMAAGGVQSGAETVVGGIQSGLKFVQDLFSGPINQAVATHAKKSLAPLSATEATSEEGLKKIFFARSGGQTPEQETAKNTAKTANKLNDIEEDVREVARHTKGLTRRKMSNV